MILIYINPNTNRENQKLISDRNVVGKKIYYRSVCCKRSIKLVKTPDFPACLANLFRLDIHKYEINS